jgi:hypothetical protein
MAKKKKAKATKPTKNDGRRLEDIVALIEGMRLPPDFKLDKRWQIRDENDIQIAELDILISGRIGTSPSTTLIECRDRPSEGPAPRNWIQQLVGRRDDLNINHVTAVSSTGFARGVARYAASKGIQLRTFQSLTAEDISPYFPATAPLLQHRVDLIGSRIGLVSPERVGTKGASISSDQSCIIDVATNERLTIFQLWNRLFAALCARLLVDPRERDETIVLDKPMLDGYAVDVEGRDFRISSLEFDVRVSNENSKMPLARADAYVNAKGERLADVVHWQGQPTDQIQGLTIIGIRKQPPPAQ